MTTDKEALFAKFLDYLQSEQEDFLYYASTDEAE